jgi:hypothetical protein
MKINWKYFFYALMSSIIVNGLVFGQIYRIHSYKKVISTSSLPIPQAFLMSGITKDTPKTSFFDIPIQYQLHYILPVVASFVILVLVLYFVIGYINKREG